MFTEKTQGLLSRFIALYLGAEMEDNIPNYVFIIVLSPTMDESNADSKYDILRFRHPPYERVS